MDNPSIPPTSSDFKSTENKKDSHKKKNKTQHFFSCDDSFSEPFIESGDYDYVGNGIYVLSLVKEHIQYLESLYLDCRTFPEDQREFGVKDWKDHYNRLQITHKGFKTSNGVQL